MRSVFFAIVPLIICCSELSLQGVEAQFPPVALALAGATATEMGLEGMLVPTAVMMFVLCGH